MKMVRKQIREDKDIGDSTPAILKIISSVVELLVTHNEIEEEVVYLGRKLLNPAEINALNELIQKELDNLPPRFEGDRRSRPRNYDED